MSSVHADRNLLFGLLALQMDFVSRDGLIEAMQAWALEKHKPLERVLQDRGLLTTEDHAVLEPLLRRHLQRHGGNPERSLAAVAVTTDLREGLRGVADPDLAASLNHLPTPPATPTPATDPAADDPEATATYAATPTTHRFRVVRPHARGGLGEVHVALDTELNREVALKQILGHRADGETDRRRFVFEAEVTGGLEHPGIVPVYSLGTDPSTGRPYYAMRFIRGDSLKDAIAAYHAEEARRAGPSERSLQLRRLLAQLIDACNAIAYAHDRGVLHRDLKPANIMVGKYGETLVVDWGLAKVIGRPDETPATAVEEATLRPPSGSGLQETLPGSALGTPQYMPPEQAEGRLELIGPPSDVYSLGATLYTILVGRSPFPQATTAEVLAAVRRGDFAPPRSIDPSVPRGLEAICLKAMSSRPEDRYPSAKDLAGDIEHWLADEPITARPDPPLVRLGRWARRHKPLVAGLAGLLLAATVGLAVGAGLLGRANRQIREREQEASANYKLAERRRVEAEANYERAEANYRLAREAVDRYFTKISENRLFNEPRMEPLRRELLEEAQDFYKQFAARRAEDSQAQVDLAWAYFHLAMISDVLGSRQEAIGHAERARSIFAKLVESDPGEPSHQRSLAAILKFVGYCYRDNGQLELAERSVRKSLEIRESQAAAFGDDPDVLKELAESCVALGYLYYRRLGRLSEGQDLMERAHALYGRLNSEYPENLLYRSRVADTCYFLGSIHSILRDLTRAEEFHEEAMRLREELIADDPLKYRFLDLARSYESLGLIYKRTGRRTEARAAFERQRQTLAEVTEKHPDEAMFQHEFARSWMNLGSFELGSDHAQQAEPLLREAIAVWERLTAEHPGFAPYHIEDLSHCLGLWSQSLDRLGRYAEAAEALDEALSLSEGRESLSLRLLRARLLALAGDHAGADEEATAALADPGDARPGDRYNAACALALAASSARDAEAEEQAEVIADRAVAELKHAHAGGFFDNPATIAHMDEDSDLDPIRDHPAYRALRLDLGFPAEPFARCKIDDP